MVIKNLKSGNSTESPRPKSGIDPKIIEHNLKELRGIFEKNTKIKDRDIGWLTMSEDTKIAHVIIPSRIQSFANILIVYGAADRAIDHVLIGNYLSSKGLNIIIQDRRGHGYSEGIEGHASYTDQFADDLVFSISQIVKKSKKPLFILGYSAGVIIALKACISAHSKNIPVAGFAIIAPTFAEYPNFMNIKPQYFKTEIRMRTGKAFREDNRPSKIKERLSGDAISTVEFNLKRYIFGRLFGIGRQKIVATIEIFQKDRKIFPYTVGGLQGYSLKDLAGLLGKIECPVLLATGENDVLIDVLAIQMYLSWYIKPQTELTSVHVRADHLSALPMVATHLANWFAKISKG